MKNPQVHVVKYEKYSDTSI